MPITFGTSLGTAVGTTPGSTWTLTTTGAVPAGGTVVVGVAWFNASTTYTVSGGGLTWTMPAAKTDGSSRNVAQAFAPAPAGLASGTVLTITVASGSFTNSAAACYANGADTLDVNGTGGIGSTQAWSGSITTLDPNTIVFGFAYNDGLAAGTSTPGSGYTEWCDFVNGADVNVFSGVYQIVSSAGAYTPGGTWSAGTNPWVVSTLSLKSGGGGGGGGGGTSTDASSNLLTGPFDHVPPAAFMPGGRLIWQPSTTAAPPPPPPPAPDPPYFTTIGGSTPQFVVSSEDWGLLSNAARNPNPASGGTYQTTFDNYFAARAAQGYNAIEVSIAHIIDYDGAQNGPDGDGVYPFTGSSLDPTGTRNTAWWDRRDYFFSSAASHGFRVFCNITTPYLSAGAFTASWTSAQWTAWGNHLAAKYPNSTHPHVFWIVGDDYFGEKDTELQALYNALNSGGATQPKGMQWYQEASSRKDIYTGGALGTSSWSTAPDYNWGYSYNVWYDVVEKMGLENNTLTPIPYVAGDGYFLQSSSTGLTDKQLMRRMVWWAISSGAKGINIGNNIVYHWASDAYAEVTGNTFFTSTVPAIVGVVNSLPNWHLLTPDTSSTLVTAGRGTHVSPLAEGGSGGQYLTDTDSYVSASYIQSGVNAGTLAVIYMSHASTITIDESKMVAGYTATWIDPASGATSTATPGPTYNSGSKGNNSDGQADWVLVLQQASSSNSGTLSASVPLVTSSISGTATNSGTLSASTPLLASSISGQSVNAGTLSASVPVLTASESGTSTDPGTLSANVPLLTASISGTATNSGTLSASVPLLTSSISDQGSSNTGILNASVPVLTASMSGTATDPGALSASTPVLTSSITGTATNSGTLSASVPRLTASISDQVANTGTLSASVPVVTAAISGQSVNPATASPSLPVLRSSISGTSANPATLAASVPVLTTALAGTMVNSGTLTASVPVATAFILDQAIPVLPKSGVTLTIDAGTKTLDVDSPTRTLE